MKILDCLQLIHNLTNERGKMLLAQMNCPTNHFDKHSEEKLIKIGMILLNELS